MLTLSEGEGVPEYKRAERVGCGDGSISTWGVSVLRGKRRKKKARTYGRIPMDQTMVCFCPPAAPVALRPPLPAFCTFSTTARPFKTTRLGPCLDPSAGAGISHFLHDESEFPVTNVVLRHSAVPSGSWVNVGGPKAIEVVRVREGRASVRRRWGGGGSREGEGSNIVGGGIERKWRLGEVVERQRRSCVGATARDHIGAEGME